MAEQDPKRYPRNKPYIQGSNTAQPQISSPIKNIRRNQQGNNSPSVMNASQLAERVHYLEEQLFTLANTLNEENKQNQQWQIELTSENERLQTQLNQRQIQVSTLKKREKERDQELKMYNDSLFKQNQQMQKLHRELKQTRSQPLRVERINNSELQEKVLELNDQISTLLVKIQQLIDQNNSLIEENNNQQNQIQNLQKVTKEFKTSNEQQIIYVQQLTDQNNYLKQEIQEVQDMAITQQNQIQNRFLQQLSETKQELDYHKNYHSKVEQYGTQANRKTDSDRKSQDKQIITLRSQIHTLEEQLLQQRQVERALRKKYDQRMRGAEHQSESLIDQVSKLKHKIRNLESSCSDHTFALEQLHKQNQRKNSIQSHPSDTEHYRNIIMRLEAEKEELSSRVKRNQAYQRQQNSSDYYNSMIHEAESNNKILKQQLVLAEEEANRNRRSSKEVTQLAKRWEDDYRRLSQEYDDALKSRNRYQERAKLEQTELARHKDIYEQLVRKYDRFEGMYKDLQNQVRLLQFQKGVGVCSKDSQQSELILLENSTLKQQISQLTLKLQELTTRQQSLPFDIVQRRMQYQLQDYKQRSIEQQKMIDSMRTRLVAETTTSRQYLEKNRQINDQLQRVNRMLNQRQRQFDDLKERYDYLHVQLNKKDQSTKHNTEMTRLKSQYVAVQRRMMENQMSAKNALQNADYQMQALKMQNNQHRRKIQQLLQEVTSQRNTVDYSNLLQSLELSQARNKELQRQLEHSSHKIQVLHEQLKRPSSRQRRSSDRHSHQSHTRPYSALPEQIPSEPTIINTLKSINTADHKNQISSRFAPSIYDQLVRDRLDLKNARSQFEKKFGNMSSTAANPIPS